MEINSYTIELIPKGVHIESNNGVNTYKAENPLPFYKASNFVSSLNEFEKRAYNYYIFDKSINIMLQGDENGFYGITLESCLSNIAVGTQDMIALYCLFKSGICDMDVYVKGKKFNGDLNADLYKIVRKSYSERLNRFADKYGDVKFRGTEKEFEKENKKQNRWYRVLARKYGIKI